MALVDSWVALAGSSLIHRLVTLKRDPGFLPNHYGISVERMMNSKKKKKLLQADKTIKLYQQRLSQNFGERS